MARDFVAASSHSLDASSCPVTTWPISMACWFNPDSTATSTLMQVAVVGSTNYHHRLVIVSTPVLSAQSQNGSVFPRANSTAAPTTGAWQHAGGVFYANADRRVYLNGGNKGTNANNCNISGFDSVAIGYTNGASPSSYFDGRIAEAAIWNVALSDEEFVKLAGGMSPTQVRPDGLVACWRVGGYQSPELDIVTGLALTVTGATAAEHAPVFEPIGVDDVIWTPAGAPPAGAKNRFGYGFSGGWQRASRFGGGD